MSNPRSTLASSSLGRTWLLGLLAALAISAAVWWPMTLPSFDFAPTHDGEYHLLRLFLLDHSLRAGLWYPRWLPGLFMGFGYPLFNFYAPLTYYLGAIFIRLGLDTYGALQTVTAGAVLAGTAGMYALATGLLGTAPRGLFAAAAYVLAPYPFIHNLYLRGAVPEMWGVALVPWVLWAGLQAYGRASLAASMALTLALSALVLLHNLSALIGAGLVLPWVAVLAAMDRHVAGVRSIVAATAAALGITAFFWLPALGERGLVQFEFSWTSYEDVSKWLYDPWTTSEARLCPLMFPTTRHRLVRLICTLLTRIPITPRTSRRWVRRCSGVLGYSASPACYGAAGFRQAVPIALFLARRSGRLVAHNEVVARGVGSGSSATHAPIPFPAP